MKQHLNNYKLINLQDGHFARYRVSSLILYAQQRVQIDQLIVVVIRE